MRLSRSNYLKAGAIAAALAAGVSAAAKADEVTVLAPNEGLFIDGETFSVAKGAEKPESAKATRDLSARELSPGTIIFRSGDKLYIAEPPARTASTVGKSFQDGWKSAMKNFQDDWKSNLKNFQDNWKSDYKDPKSREDYISYMKSFQDSWANYMKAMPEDAASMPEVEQHLTTAMKNFQDDWKSNMKGPVAAQAMKDFQDQWKSYVKNFQDQWKNNYMKNPETPSQSGQSAALKQFQDHWSTSYAK
ncbi:MAG TPA: hypothetical protein VNR11_01605 [Xanthobacteraceae bacterium]|nr:hypothetical protein [Xanthobacteraceae bacterium]